MTSTGGGGGLLPKLQQLSMMTTRSKRRSDFKLKLKSRIKKEIRQAPEYAIGAFKAVPAVLLGCLLNILDGVSCEYIYIYILKVLF